MDVRKDATRCDGDTSEELVELLIVANRKLNMAGDDASFLVVTSSVASKLENLGSEILEAFSFCEILEAFSCKNLSNKYKLSLLDNEPSEPYSIILVFSSPETLDPLLPSGGMRRDTVPCRFCTGPRIFREVALSRRVFEVEGANGEVIGTRRQFPIHWHTQSPCTSCRA